MVWAKRQEGPKRTARERRAEWARRRAPRRNAARRSVADALDAAAGELERAHPLWTVAELTERVEYMLAAEAQRFRAEARALRRCARKAEEEESGQLRLWDGKPGCYVRRER